MKMFLSRAFFCTRRQSCHDQAKMPLMRFVRNGLLVFKKKVSPKRGAIYLSVARLFGASCPAEYKAANEKAFVIVACQSRGALNTTEKKRNPENWLRMTAHTIRFPLIPRILFFGNFQ